MSDLELAVRTIEKMIPTLSTKQLQKWQGILQSAQMKIDAELKATHLHTCVICFFKEYGYRDELPSSWYKKGDAEICFQHEYDQAEKLLKDAGHDDSAFFPPESSPVTVESLKTTMNSMEPAPTETDKTLEDLMDLV